MLISRTLVATAGLGLVIGLGGCSEGDAPASARSKQDSVSAASTSTTPEPSTADPGTSEPDETTPSVEPADGKVFKMTSSRVRLPKGWYVTSGSSAGQMAAYALGKKGMVALDWPPLGSETETMAGRTLSTLRKTGTFRRMENLELPICSAFQLVGREKLDNTYKIVVGCTTRGRQYEYEFSTGEGGDAEIRPIMESIFAAMEWD